MFKRAAFKTLFALNVGAFSYLGYKTYQKSQKHPPTLKFVSNDQLKFDKNAIQYNLKNRNDHIKEAASTEYDVLVIGWFTLNS
jgi:hypothetical protein